MHPAAGRWDSQRSLCLLEYQARRSPLRTLRRRDIQRALVREDALRCTQPPNNLGFWRPLTQVVVCARFQAFENFFIRVPRSVQYDVDISGIGLAANGAAQFQSVHTRHAHVQHTDLSKVLLDGGQRGLAVCRLGDIVARWLNERAQVIEHEFIIVNKQDFCRHLRRSKLDGGTQYTHSHRRILFADSLNVKSTVRGATNPFLCDGGTSKPYASEHTCAAGSLY